MQLLIPLGLLAALASVGATATASFAGSATCSGGIPHCYAVAQFGGAGSTERFHGMSASVYASCLSTTNPSSLAVTDEAWLIGSFQNVVWIEAGIAYGVPLGGRRYYFWADQAPGRGYAEHDDSQDGQSSLGNDAHAVEAVPYSDTAYLVESGPYSGTTGGWPSQYGFNTLQAGTETYNGSGASTYVGGSSNLVWESQNNNYVQGWSYGSDGTFASRIPNSWGFVSTVSQNHEYHHGVTTTC